MPQGVKRNGTGSASAVADHSSYSNSSSDGDINVVSSNSNSVNNNSRNMTYNNCDSSFGSSSGSSSSRTKEESSACGVDDGPDEESYPYFKPHPADHQSTEAGLFGLDEHLTQLVTSNSFSSLIFIVAYFLNDYLYMYLCVAIGKKIATTNIME